MQPNDGQPNSLDEKIRASYHRVMDAYESLGYPRELLGQWALPERDALTLLAKVAECEPRNVLEIGTYVGVTSLLLALHTALETRIHTVDPNFPLQIEMSAMQSKLYDSNVAVRTQQIAWQAAHSLELDGRIDFHEGGFSVGSTFASNNADPLARVEVIGDSLCTQYGPFDFIFVDGLHYEDAVYSDLKLAARYVTPDGVIGIHDAKGRWASNVRRAVFRFLAEHEDFVFLHTPFTEVDRAVGFIGRPGSGRLQRYGEAAGKLTVNGLVQQPILSNLASTIVELFSPRRVIQFHTDGLDLGEALLERGVAEVRTVRPGSLRDEVSRESGGVPNLRGLAQDEKYDLCLCLGVAEKLPPESATKLIEACTGLSDRVVFAATPPGEFGEDLPNLHPLSHWAKTFLQNGFVLRDAIRPRLEPLTYVDQVFSDYRVTSSYLQNLYLAERQDAIGVDGDSGDFVQHLLLDKEARIEDLSLQNLYQTLIIYDVRQQLVNAQNRAGELEDTRRKFEEALRTLDEVRRAAESTRRALEIARQTLRRGSLPVRALRRIGRALGLRADKTR